MSVLPVYLRLAQIAEVSGMPTRELRTILKGSCALVRHGKWSKRALGDRSFGGLLFRKI